MDDIYLKVENKVKETVNKLNEKFKFNLEYPYIYYDIKGKNAGLAKSLSMTVHYNPKLLKENEEDFLKNTVPHEVCHIAVYHYYKIQKKPIPKNGHGPDWQIMMRSVGVNPRKYHTYKVERKIKIFKYKCKCIDGVIISERMHKKNKELTHHLVCKKCKSILKDYEMIIQK